jgi:hypothetical protein
MQKLVFFYGSFDKNGNWHDNREEINKELAKGWYIKDLKNQLFIEPLLIKKNIKKKDNNEIVSPIILERASLEDEALLLEIGSALIDLQGEDEKLTNEIKHARKNLFFPKVRILDNFGFDPNEYKLFAFGIMVAKGLVNEEYSSEEKISQILFTIVNYVHGNNVVSWCGD